MAACITMLPIVAAAPVLAHGTHAAHSDSPFTWTWAPLPMVGITCAAVVYAVGLTRLWRHAGVGRGVHRWQAASFAAGLIALVVALLSPLDTISDQLSWVHMIQHMTLMLVAAPLLVAGSPGAVATWTLSARARRRVARVLAQRRVRVLSRYTLWHPIVLWLVYAGVLWVWHVPRLYSAALHNELVHDVQHLAFLLAAGLYWRVLLDPVGRVQLTPTLAVAYLFTTSLHGMLLGVFMALSQRVWYPFYENTTSAWNLTALEDQQIAGYIMWMPVCAVYAVVAAAILGLWLHRSAQNDQPADSLATVPAPVAADAAEVT